MSGLDEDSGEDICVISWEEIICGKYPSSGKGKHLS
jgi:hypothetical protein